MTKGLLEQHTNKIVIGLIAGVVVMAGIFIISDFTKLIQVISEIKIPLLLLAFLFAPLNYLLRYFRWNYYLNQIGIKLPPKINRVIFASGLCMNITPGKVGEFLKAYLIKKYNNTEITKTSPIIVTERITDMIAMILLASLGALKYSYGGYTLLITLIFLIGLIVVFHFDKLFDFFMAVLSKIKRIKGFLHLGKDFRDSARKLLSLKSLTIAIALSLIAWGLEGFVVFFVLKSLGISISLLSSIFIFSVSSVLGAISTLPGGLGVAEGSMIGAMILLGVTKTIAFGATLITRFATLWFGVFIGIVGLYFAKKILIERALD